MAAMHKLVTLRTAIKMSKHTFLGSRSVEADSVYFDIIISEVKKQKKKHQLYVVLYCTSQLYTTAEFSALFAFLHVEGKLISILIKSMHVKKICPERPDYKLYRLYFLSQFHYS